jgi:O-antigen ligase
MQFKEGVKIKTAIEYIKKDIDRFLLICLAASLPFDRIPSVDIFGVSLRFSLFFSVLIILRAIYSLFKKKIKLRFSIQDKLLTFFVIWLVLIIPVSINFNRALTVALFTIFVIIAALSISLLFKKEYFKPISKALFAVSIIVVGFGIYQYFGDIFNLPSSLTGLRERYTWSIFGFPRIQSFSLEPLYMAAFLLLPYSIATAYYLLRDNTFNKKLVITVIGLCSFAIFMSVSRGGIYAMIISSVILSFYLIFTKKARFAEFLKLFLVVAIAFLASLILINYLNKAPSAFTKGKKGSSAFVDQVKNTSFGEGDERSQARSQAIKILNDNKSSYIIGIGPGQFGPYAQNNKPADYGWTIVNNMPLEVLLETGLVGASLLVIFIITIFIKSYKLINISKDKTIIVLAMGLWAYLISQAVQIQTYSTLYILYLWFPIGIVMGVLRNNNAKKPKQ